MFNVVAMIAEFEVDLTRRFVTEAAFSRRVTAESPDGGRDQGRRSGCRDGRNASPHLSGAHVRGGSSPSDVGQQPRTVLEQLPTALTALAELGTLTR